MTLQKYIVGVTKIPFADRDVAHEALAADEDREFVDIIGADTPDVDDDFPLGSNCTYSLWLSEEEAAEFAAASNCRYVELAREYLPLAVTDKHYITTYSLEMRNYIKGNDPETELWDGKGVPLGIADSGVSQRVIDALGLTVGGRQVFGSMPINEFNTQGSHGSACTSVMSPFGSVLYDAPCIGENGAFDNQLAAMKWLADQGVKVVNFSGGVANPNNEQPGQGDKDVAAYCQARGVIWSTPAGNSAFSHLEIPGLLAKTYFNVTATGAWDSGTNGLWSGSSHEDGMTCVVPSGAWRSLCFEDDPTKINLAGGGTSLSCPMMGYLIARICTGGRFTAFEALAALKATMTDMGVARSIQGGGMPNLKAALTYLGAFNDSALITNLSPNPSCGSNTTGWSTPSGGTRKTDLNPLLFPRATGYECQNGFDTAACAVTVGQTYTHSITVRVDRAISDTGIGIRWINSGGSVISTGSIRSLGPMAAGGVVRVSVTGTAPTGAVSSKLTFDDNTDTAVIHASGHLCVAATQDKTYFDGSSTGALVQAAWTGTAQNSTSTVKYKKPVQPLRYNLCPNPSFENNLTGWEVGSIKAGATATLARFTSGGKFGVSYLGVQTSNAENNNGSVPDFVLRSPFCDVTAGETYSASAFMKSRAAVDPPVQVQIEWYSSGGSLLSQSGTAGFQWKVGSNEFNRYWDAGVAPSTATKARIKISYYGQMNNDANVVETLQVDAVMLEKGLESKPLFDGSMPTAAWTGTTGSSTSYLGTPDGTGGGGGGGGGGEPAGQIQQYGFVNVTDNGSTISLQFVGYSADGTQRVTDTYSVSTPNATPVTPPTTISQAPLKVTAHLAESGSTAHDYFDGFTVGASWSGTPGNSTSLISTTSQVYRKNLSTNPSFENNTTGYSVGGARSGITLGALGRSQTITPSNAAWYATFTVTGNGSTSSSPDFEVTFPDADVAAGLSYFFSAALRHQVASTEIEWQVEWRTATGTISTVTGGRELLVANEWDRVWMVANAPTGAVIARPKLRGYNHTSSSANSFRLDAVLIEQASDRVEYFDGNFTGGTWTGTAGNSTSYLGTPPGDGGGGGDPGDLGTPPGNFLYRKAYEGFLNGLIDWDTATIKAALVRGYTRDVTHTTMADVTAAGGTVVATTSAFTGKTVTDGNASAAPASFGTVASGAAIANVIVYQSSLPTGGADVAASSQRIIACLNTGQNFPITPNGGSISLQFSLSGIFTL